MLYLNVQSIDLPINCTDWQFWMMRQLNGCSTPPLRSSVGKQWFEELAQRTSRPHIASVIMIDNYLIVKS